MATYKNNSPTTLDYLKVFTGFGLLNFFLSAAFPLLDAQILGMLAKNPKLSKEQFGNQRMFGAAGHFASTLLSFIVYKNLKGTLIFNLLTYIGFFIAVVFGVQDIKVAKGGHHGHHAPQMPRVDEKGKDVIRSPSPMPVAEGLHQVPIAQAMTMAPSPAPPSAADELCAEGGAGVKHPVIALLTNPSFMFFMVFVAGMGTVRSVTSSFQKLIALDVASVDPKNPSWMALTFGLSPLAEKHLLTALVDFGRMLSEIFVYVYAKSMRNAMGIYWILVLSQLVGIVRMYGYGLLPNRGPNVRYSYYGAWILELLKGFSSGMVSSSAIPIASRIAPAGCESTAQGLFSGNYSGLSNGISGVVSGLILNFMYEAGNKIKEKDDIQSMFCWVSLGTFVVTIAMAAKFVFIDRVMGVPGFPRRHSLPS
jgi:hypothetical protein